MKQCVYHSVLPIQLSTGRQIYADVRIYTEYDQYYEVDEDFETPEQEQEYRDKLQSGALEALVVTAVASYGGMFGYASLGAAVVGSLSDLRELISEYGMQEVAADDLKKNIEQLLSSIA